MIKGSVVSDVDGIGTHLLGYFVQDKYINDSIVCGEEERELEEYGGRGKLKNRKKKRRYNKIEDRGGKREGKG